MAVVCGQAKTPHPPQAKGGQSGKGPIEKQSREEKTKGGKEQEEERPGPVGIRARTNEWERRFRQEVLVAQRVNPTAKSPQRRAHSVPKSALGEARQSECYRKTPLIRRFAQMNSSFRVKRTRARILACALYDDMSTSTWTHWIKSQSGRRRGSRRVPSRRSQCGATKERVA